MASADQLKALVKSHIDGDDRQFYSIAMQVAAHEAKVGHGRLAEELRDMIDAAKTRAPVSESAKKLVQIARPRGELANLLTVQYPASRLADMVLDPIVGSQLERIVKEQRAHERIREHGLSPRRKLLLIGPPGTGKTMTAAVLAGELGIPLFTVRLDGLITKFMGETAAKLRQVFDAVSEVRGVYFFDEFDAIGSQRGLSNDVGEIRRVLNSFLQMIEHDHSTSLIMAATNHPEILDYALFRRFDDVIEYRLPTDVQAIELMRSRLGRYAPKALPNESLASVEGLSFAEIRRAVDEAIKEAIMHDQKQVLPAGLTKALDERRQLKPKLANNKTTPSHDGPTKR